MLNFNSRDEALELVENGVVTAEQMLTMALKYMSTDDVADMLDCNELSARFMDEDDDDGQPDWHQEWESMLSLPLEFVLEWGIRRSKR